MTDKAKPTTIVTPMFRVSFPNLFTPNEFEGKKKYGVTALFKKSDIKQWEKVLALVDYAAFEKWGKKPAQLQLWTSPLKDGDVKAANAEEGKYQDYKGCYSLSFQSEYGPGIVDAAREDILDSEEVYAGCYGRAQVNVYAWEYANSKGTVMKRGVSFGLLHFQKLDEGERIGGARTAASDAFDDGTEASADI
jgi:hypothetical protein